MKNRLAVVTGGTRGIGAAIAIALHHAGYQVAANYHAHGEAADRFSGQHHIKTYRWDVADLDQCKAGLAKISNDFSMQPSILVNNAGITRDGVLHRMTEKAWQEVIVTNLNSCFYMCSSVIPAMRQMGFGRIINISSINALSGQVGQTNYSASKAGIIGFSKSLAKENAQKGITVNVVAPGYVKTSMTEAVPEKIMQSIIAGIPVGRLGDPEEIARAVLFLADDQAGFITGETLSINGGQYMA